MRTEKEMFELIRNFAEKDHRIRAVFMNGSRTNSKIQKDIFQDYDIVYVVTDVESFVKEENWVSVFGEIIMLQEPEKMDKAIGIDIDPSENYGYLMLFADGNRIDLHLQTKEYMLRTYEKDSLTIPLMDKDNWLPKIPPASDQMYWIKKPTEAQYFSACNNFWWCMQNVAKGLWREQLPYARQMFEMVIRRNLDDIVTWWIGVQHDFKVSTGLMGKYYEQLLPHKHWEMYRKTYATADYEQLWNSIFVACDLFRLLALEVAEELGYHYSKEDDHQMTSFLMKVRDLPKDAKAIF